jgi:mutator protein MutT
VKADEKISIAVDAIIEDNSGNLLFVRRKKDPFKGKLSLPGGKVDLGEIVEEAVKREVLEETNLKVIPTEILGVYSDPKRDPRGHRVSISFVVKIIDGEAKAGDDADSLNWLPVTNNEILAFDHNRILNDFKKWKESRGTYWSSKN